MPWFNFTEDFNWRASKRGFRQFLKGQRVNVTRACAEEALAKGKGYVEGDAETVVLTDPPAPIDVIEEPETDDRAG